MQPFWASSVQSVRALDAARSEWDILYLQGQPLPGLATVTGQRHQKIDLKMTPGADMSTMTNIGTEPAIVTVRLRLWTPDHWTQWQKWVPILEPRPGKARKDPVSCHHPALAIHRITKLWVKMLGFVQESGIPGIRTVDVNFWEWAPTLKINSLTPLTAQSAPDLSSTPQALPPKPPPSQTENIPPLLVRPAA